MSWFSKEEENKMPNREEYRKFLLQKDDIVRDFRAGNISKAHLKQLIDKLETIIKEYAEDRNCSIPDAWERYKNNYAEMKEAELNPVTPREALVHLAEKANDFFEQEYRDSDEIKRIIKTYSELLAKRYMEIFNGLDKTNESVDETIKPLLSYYDKLWEWIFTTIKSSMQKKFPRRAYFLNQVHTVCKDEEDMHSTICGELTGKLMSGFVFDLYNSMKEHFERVLQNDYPIEYASLHIKEEWINGVWNELYGRSIKVIYDCMKSLGLDIPLDKEKFILGNLVVTGQGEGIIIDKSAIFGNVNNESSYYINIIREKMIEINAGVNIDNGSSVGGSIINKPTVIVGSNNDEVLKSISGLISDIQKSNLEVAKDLISLLQDLTQAIQTNNIAKQTETKQKFSGFWLAVGNTVKSVLQSSAHLTTVFRYLGIELC